MTPPGTCPQCGGQLAPATLPGLCPRCLMLGGMNAQAVDAKAGAGRPQPPDLERLNAALPGFEVCELIGSGAMGWVFRAHQKRLDRPVAIKILASTTEADPELPARLQREAQMLARLNHPNIVTVHDFGESDGICYLVMELVEGVTLADMIRNGAVTPALALSIIPQICDALQFAHEHGVVHRDIKPGNILLTADGRIKVADFGLVKIVERDDDDLLLTFANQYVGTPLYMAPEQRENPLEVDHRADIYSLGVVVYELLTGRLPVGRFQRPSKSAAVSKDIDQVVLRALESEPDKRFHHASELRNALQAAHHSRPPPVRRFRFGVAAAAVVALAAIAWAILANRPTPAPPAATTDAWTLPGPSGQPLLFGLNLRGEFDTIPRTLKDAVAATVDGYDRGHGLALLKSGHVLAWGNNLYGQCDVPDDLDRVTAIAQGWTHSVALRDDGTVVAWGRNDRGQIDVPDGLDNVTAITAAHHHSAALTADGQVVLWGADYDGALAGAPCEEPVVNIEAGMLHLLGITESSEVVAWGDNSMLACSVPSEATGVIDVAAGDQCSVALRKDGRLVFWGHDAGGVSLIPEGDHYRAVSLTGLNGCALRHDGRIDFFGELAGMEGPDPAQGAFFAAPGWFHTIVLATHAASPLPSSETIDLGPAVAFAPHNSPIFDLAVTGDGKQVATVSGSILRFIDLGERHPTASLSHRAPLWAVASTSSFRSGLVACAADDGKVLLAADADPEHWLETLPVGDERVSAVAISQDGDRLAAGTVSGTLFSWNRDTTGAYVLQGSSRRHDDTIADLAFAPGSSETLFSAGWDGGEDKGVVRWHLPEAGPPVNDLALPGWRYKVQSLAFTRRFVAFGDWDGCVTLWHRGDLRHEGWFRTHFEGPASAPYWLGQPDGRSAEPRSVSCTFTSDGRYLITGGADRVVRIWEVGTHESSAPLRRIAVIEGFDEPIRALAVTPDGRSLVASGWNDSLTLWDLSLLP